MNSSTIFFVVCLVFGCAMATLATPVNAGPDGAAIESKKIIDTNVAPVEERNRQKRFFPLSYSAVSPVISTGYSYLAPYANTGKIINYPAPVYGIGYHAAYPAPISAYSLL